MELINRGKSLIEAGSFDEAEALWMTEMERDPTRLDEFMTLAKMLRKADERARADALLELLADALRERDAWPERFRVLKELGRLSKKPALLKEPLVEALTHAFGSRTSFKKVLDVVRFGEPNSNPLEKAEKAENWLRYDVGEPFFMPGRGAGVVIELNPDLGVCRLDFEKEKRVSVPLGAAPKNLVPLGPDHLLRRRISDPEGLKQWVAKNPAAALEQLLRSFDRPMTAAEVKDAMIGIVPDTRWASWWTAARKHPQIVVHGTGAKATYSWTASTDHADQAIRSQFAKVGLREKLELAKKHSGRNAELADEFSAALAAEAARVAKSQPAVAWEVLTSLEKLPGKYERTLDPDSLLSGPLASRVVTAIPDRQLRERALQSVRQKHGDWPRVYGELFFLEEDPRTLGAIIDELTAAGEVSQRERLLDETLRYPRRHPRAFYWFCKWAEEQKVLPDRAGYTLLFQMLDAISSEEFGSLRPRLKDFFDKGGLAVRIVMSRDDEEQARKLVETLDRYGNLEEYRRDTIRGAAIMKYPDLREPQVEPLFATAESLSGKRQEFERLKNVEMPANLKAIQEAREMGDLRENFEYKSARQRQEYLTARVSELASELGRVRLIEPSQVDPSQVRIGTRVALRNGEVERNVTILGPWESDPEHGIYSHQSDAARSLLGKTVGEIATFMGNDYEVVAIQPWKG